MDLIAAPSGLLLAASATVADAPTSPYALLLPALPALAAVIKVLKPSEGRGLSHRMRALLELREKLPEGRARDELDVALVPMARQMAFLEDQRLRRHVDGSTVAAIVFVLLVGGGLSFVMWQLDHIVWKGLALLLAAFATLLVTVGGFSSMMKVEETYPFEPKAPKVRKDGAKRQG